MSVMRWLLRGDPAIRWQVMRDLMNEPVEVAAAERARVALEGWGAKVLELQTPGGHWGGDDESRTWMTTTYTLVLLKDLGADPVAKEVRTALDRVREHITRPIPA